MAAFFAVGFGEWGGGVVGGGEVVGVRSAPGSTQLSNFSASGLSRRFGSSLPTAAPAHQCCCGDAASTRPFRTASARLSVGRDRSAPIVHAQFPPTLIDDRAIAHISCRSWRICRVARERALTPPSANLRVVAEVCPEAVNGFES